ncbi:Uncharacterised protein [Vibrio cholerae]|nr:Uncharacterised protein [Vibrio cholerae]
MASSLGLPAPCWGMYIPLPKTGSVLSKPK